MDDGLKYDVKGERKNAFENAIEKARDAMVELGTEGMTPEQILGAPTIIYPGPRAKKHQAGYRAGFTKKHNRGTPKKKRIMTKESKRINRKRG